LFANSLGDLAQFDFRGMKDRVLLLLLQPFFQSRQFKQMDPLERPAVRFGDCVELFLRFRQGDVQPALPAFLAIQKILQRQGGFARSGIAFDQV
jgi:hypothetical protein